MSEVNTIVPKEINTRIKLKRDTESNWDTQNPVILNGEVALVDGTDGRLRAKIGDGETEYDALEFLDNIHIITAENKDEPIPVNAIIVIDITDGSVDSTGTVSPYMPNVLVDSEDNGKVLMVSNGAWAAMTITPINGKDGVSPTVTVDEISGGHRVTITDGDGPNPFNVMNGINGNDGQNGKSAYEIAYALDSTIGTETEWIASLKGADGSDGDNGISVTIISTTESENDGGKNVVTFSDGSTITIKNGSAGAPFTYDQFKPEELEALKPKKGTDYFDGEDYILTDADKIEIANEAIELLDDTIEEITEIASGKCNADAFDTVDAMTTWLNTGNNAAGLKLGDVFYIRAVDVPDYWWEPIRDGTELSKYTEKDVIISGIGAARILETTKVKLEDYALIANVPGIKVNNAANADTISGKQIVVSTEAPDPNGADNQNIITIVI